MSTCLARRVAALTLPVRLLSRLVGRDEAHSSKNDEMREDPTRGKLASGFICPAYPECQQRFLGQREAQEHGLSEHGIPMAHDWDAPRSSGVSALARPARALTPGSPGDVQKGERT